MVNGRRKGSRKRAFFVGRIFVAGLQQKRGKYGTAADVMA
jgi:hypothetical protein